MYVHAHTRTRMMRENAQMTAAERMEHTHTNTHTHTHIHRPTYTQKQTLQGHAHTNEYVKISSFFQSAAEELYTSSLVFIGAGEIQRASERQRDT